jgi:hypothetical protein
MTQTPAQSHAEQVQIRRVPQCQPGQTIFLGRVAQSTRSVQLTITQPSENVVGSVWHTELNGHGRATVAARGSTDSWQSARFGSPLAAAGSTRRVGRFK